MVRLARVVLATRGRLTPQADAELIVIDAELAPRTTLQSTARQATGLHILPKRSSETAFDACCSGCLKQRRAGSKRQQTSSDDARFPATRRPVAPASAPEQRLGAAAVTPSGRDLRRLRRRCINRTPTHKKRRRRLLRRHGPPHEGREKQKAQNEAGAPDALGLGWW